jgi:hypothetical protein
VSNENKTKHSENVSLQVPNILLVVPAVKKEVDIVYIE